MMVIWVYLIKMFSTLAKTIITSSLVANLSEEPVLSFCQTSANNLADTSVFKLAGVSGAKYISLMPLP